MSGRLIVIDGLDGTGKSTQIQAVYERLRKEDDRILSISFPDYEKPSSALVRMYLNGELSQDAGGVNAYAASSFYAVDRYASYKQYWEKEYLDGYTVLAARYTTSNAIYQMEKLPVSQWDSYLDWLSDYEYQKLGLPSPDRVILLDMPRSVADRLILSRYAGDESRRDLHERDLSYLERCREASLYAAKKQGWTVIPCADAENPYPRETITQLILDALQRS